MNYRRSLFFLATLPTVLACAPINDAQPTNANVAEAVPETAEVAVEVLSLAEVEAVIASQGKPVVLDLWALW